VDASIPARQATAFVGPATLARPRTFEHAEPVARASPTGSTAAEASTQTARTNIRRSARTDAHTVLDTYRHFEDLEESLTGIVAAPCGGTLTIEKSDFGPVGEPVEASGWTFAATLTPPPQHEWLTPSSAGKEPTARVATDAVGRGRIPLEAHEPGERDAQRPPRELAAGLHS
jgi:hypothetical protein